ncbi:hypothetical protein OMW55_08355 [Sphingomonas sp. BN140010]|uniref:Pentapeptide MXKDX repeat protein n=1 Tax=Sphingomonas arvum TaxID=2992113 RepID=A0ABT3JFF1_9SPHN|nr:hypothetical protein [Sphingomonas sp. BN140010]MCW3797813.1 hypothetical protein [Sphingomonas sp. BN140010]
MRALILVAGAALSLSACGGNSSTNDANTMATDNMMMDSGNMSMDQNMMMDSNMSNMGMDANMSGGMDGNMSTNAATESNMMAQDRNTNAPDTNIANGM